jgi:hypothetical protein
MSRKKDAAPMRKSSPKPENEKMQGRDCSVLGAVIEAMKLTVQTLWKNGRYIAESWTFSTDISSLEF